MKYLSSLQKRALCLKPLRRRVKGNVLSVITCTTGFFLMCQFITNLLPSLFFDRLILIQ